jgi:NADH:ubiquinone oxidoreductase subunit 3 (subunit A)
MFIILLVIAAVLVAVAFVLASSVWEKLLSAGLFVWLLTVILRAKGLV